MFLRKKYEKIKVKDFSNLYLGHKNGKSGREFILYIANAVKERVVAFLESSDFMSILTDGSQARKTGIDKDRSLFLPKEMVSFLFIVVFESNKNGRNNLRYFCSNRS